MYKQHRAANRNIVAACRLKAQRTRNTFLISVSVCVMTLIRFKTVVNGRTAWLLRKVAFYNVLAHKIYDTEIYYREHTYL